MHTLDNIDRLHAPTRALVDEYIESGRPFICDGLLGGSRFDLFHDKDAAVAALGSGTIGFDASGKHHEGTVADYFRVDDVGRGSVNVAFPAALAGELLDVARTTAIGRSEMDMTAWMGRIGCLQRLHCDMDCSHNFLVQAFGTKRVCLVSPMETQKLQPAIDKQLLFSEVPFHRYDDDAKLAMLRFVDGRDAILSPGETLYIPPLWWHCVEYLSDSLSLSWRFHHHSLVREMAGAWPVLWTREWPLWQGIVSRVSSQPMLAERHAGRVREIVALAARRDGGTRASLRALHDELCPGRYALEFGRTDLAFFEARVERPLPPHQGPWRADDRPRVQPYTRFGAIGETILVIDADRVVAEIAIDADDFVAIESLLEAVQRGDGGDVATLAQAIGLDVDDACAVLAQFSREGWIA